MALLPPLERRGVPCLSKFMKNKVKALTKVILKNSFQNMETAKETGKNKKSKSMIILYIFVFLYLGGIIGVFSNGLIKELIAIKQEQMFIGLILLGIAGFVLIQSIFSAINILYYAKDNEYILPLPVKPSEIIAAKTNVLIITEYIVIAIVGLIPLIIYGILTSANFFYYISMLVVILVFPIIPVLISSLLVLIVMSFAKFTKNKNRFQLIATLFIMAIVFVLSFTTSNQETSPEELIQMVTKANGLVENIKGAFPTLKMAIESLVNSSLTNQILNLLLLIILTGIIYALYLIVGQKLYLKGAVGNLSSGKKTKKKIDEGKAFKKTTLMGTYVGKEFKTLIRNPVFFMQCVLPAIIFPILIIGMSFIGLKGEQNGELTSIANMIQNKNSIYLGAGILCMVEFFLMFIYISATAISREGENAKFIKYIPVPFIKQIDYKVFPNIAMTTFMSIITIIMVEYLLKIPLIYLLLITITSIILGIFQSYASIIIDLKRPKLEWNSEYAVVKQNMNLMWPVLLGIINITIIIVMAIILKFINSYIVINSYIFIALIGLIYLILTKIVRNYIKKNEEKLLEKIY